MESLDYFCGSPFWDDNIAWNTTDPDFPVCFQKTVFVWVPCGFLWLFCPLEVYYLNKNGSQKRHVPWTALNITKVVFSFLLFITSLLDMSHWLYLNTLDVRDVPYSNFNSPFIKAATYFLSFILLIVAKRKGRRTSGVLFIFWFLSSISLIVGIRTALIAATDSVRYINVLDFVFTSLSFPLIIGQVILASFVDEQSLSKSSATEQRNVCPEMEASFLSRLLFAWFDKLAYLGYKRPLVTRDLWKLKPEVRCGEVVSTFNKYWNEEKQKIRPADKKPSILSALWKTFRWPFMFAGVLRFVADMLTFASPLILQMLIGFVSSDEPMWRGIFYAVCLFGASFLQSLINGQQYLLMFNIAMRVRSAVVSSIYRKALRINSTVKRTSTVGEIVNLMSVDAQRLMDLLPELHVLWSALIQIGIALYLLYQQLGPSVFAGLVVMLLMIPLNGVIAGRFKILQIKQMKNKDERVKQMNEILNGIKVLKLYAWEESFCDQIDGLRGEELKVMKKAAYLQAISSFVFNIVPFIVTLATFATYVLIDDSNVLDATKAFVSLSLFGIIRLPMFFIPMLFISMLQASVSFTRMNKFLNSDELKDDVVGHDESALHPVVLERATFSWGPEEDPTLKDLTFNVPDEALVAVVGPVGTGKSSLISGILGDMDKPSGTVNTRGSIALVAQQAWIQNATLRDNILFGKPYEARKYQTVLDACALTPDLAVLPGGDQTEIGEKGINLSGGQKQRVALARAVYSDSSVYLLDDPLSAVDSHVGKHIFENVIGPEGLLKNKTRLFVTNGVTFLPKVDTIIVLSEKKISEKGSYKELLQKKGAFADFLMTYLTEKEEKEDLTDEELTDLEELAQDLLNQMGPDAVESKLARRLSTRGATSESERDERSKEEQQTEKSIEASTIKSPELRYRKLSHHISRDPNARAKRVSVAPKQETPANLAKRTLVQNEGLETGKVGWHVYLRYIRSMGFWTSVFTAVMYFSSAGFQTGSNFWLSIWSEDQPLPDGTQDLPLRDLRLGIYGGLGLGQALVVLGGSYAMALASINASGVLHRSMLYNILRCPMAFFDTTPIGRIVNRFSKDIDVIDTTIPMIIRPLIGTFLQVLSTFVIVSISTPIFLTVVLPIAVFYYIVQRFYVSTSRQLKRIESVSRSPIFSHFSETIAGATTIRAYGRSNDFVLENEVRVDTNQTAYYPSIIANRWLSVRLELIANTMVICAAIFAVLAKGTIDPGTVGLSISYASAVTSTLTFMVRMTCDLETNIVAVERVQEYSEEKSEAVLVVPENRPTSSWPHEGKIHFQNYMTRYRAGLDLVLKGISCHVKRGEKIGIVGRTGAGKSSLTLALFRLIEPVDGTILIDDVDISKIGLHDLRSKLTIIPQDPVLFSGSLRMNLDPFSNYTDDAVWKALENGHLKTFVKSLPAGLQYAVSEGGDNLSVGQRQLVCLARALLRKTQVLILDEATAAVDLETDDLIQETIRKEFADATVLTIAHRLNTILDSTRVMVLEDGQIKEFAPPSELLQDKNSSFYSMAEDAGLI